MGLLGKLFGSADANLPELDAQSEAAMQLNACQEALDEVVHKTHDRLEVVPAHGKVFIFVGKPPKHFGLAWVEGEHAKSIKEYIQENNLDSKSAMNLNGALGQAYERAQAEPRFHTKMVGRDIVVIPSGDLADEVDQILQRGGNA